MAALVLVAAAFLLLQVRLFDTSRFLEWDEAVYIGHSTDRYLSPGWAADRSLGVPWLLTPYFWVSESISGMRLYLASMSSILLTVAFLPWVRLVGWAAPAGLVVFLSTSWLPIFYGSEASPNLYVAAMAVGAVGAAGLVRGGEDGGVISLGAFVAAMALFRPSDALVLAGALGAWLASSPNGVVRRRSLSAVVGGGSWRDSLRG